MAVDGGSPTGFAARGTGRRAVPHLISIVRSQKSTIQTVSPGNSHKTQGRTSVPVPLSLHYPELTTGRPVALDLTTVSCTVGWQPAWLPKGVHYALHDEDTRALHHHGSRPDFCRSGRRARAGADGDQPRGRRENAVPGAPAQQSSPH